MIASSYRTGRRSRLASTNHDSRSLRVEPLEKRLLLAVDFQLATVRGVTEVDGELVTVQALFAVHPGTDAQQQGANVLTDLGARPFQSADFTFTGLVWDQFLDGDAGNDEVIQHYNPANDPLGGAGEAALTNSQDTWNAVATSSFVFVYGGETDRCPSLVDQCKGAQTFDGKNDVAWLAFKGRGSSTTLGVTWSGNQTDEADIAMNTRFTWHNDENNDNDVDAQTVFLHENGHALGLGHSNVSGAVMEPVYAGPRRTLHQDEKDGITDLYAILGDPVPGITVSPTSGLVTSEDGGTDTFMVVLDTQPTHSVTIDISSDDTLEGTINPANLLTLSFTTENWDTPQTVTVTGVEDTGLIDGNAAYSIITAAAMSLDAVYAAINPDDVSVTNTDNDAVEATEVSVALITYATQGGRRQDKNLLDTITVVDDFGAPVSGASVSIELDNSNGQSWTGTAATDSNGAVTFSLKNAPDGIYTTDILAIDATGLVWDGVTPANSYTKPSDGGLRGRGLTIVSANPSLSTASGIGLSDHFSGDSATTDDAPVRRSATARRAARPTLRRAAVDASMESMPETRSVLRRLSATRRAAAELPGELEELISAIS
jgi:hypothetical protein